MAIERYQKGKYWAVYDEQAKLICLTVYKKGAVEVSRRLGLTSEPAGDTADTVSPPVVSESRPNVYRRRK